MKPLSWIVTALFSVLSLTTEAADETRINITLDHHGDDTYGKQLDFRFREELRKSSLFRLRDSNDDTAPEVFTIDLFTRGELGQGDSQATYFMANFAVLDPRTKLFVVTGTKWGAVGSKRIEEEATELIIWAAKQRDEGAPLFVGWQKEGCR